MATDIPFDGWTNGGDFSSGTNQLNLPNGRRAVFLNGAVFMDDGSPVPPEILAQVRQVVPDARQATEAERQQAIDPALSVGGGIGEGLLSGLAFIATMYGGSQLIQSMAASGQIPAAAAEQALSGGAEAAWGANPGGTVNLAQTPGPWANTAAYPDYASQIANGTIDYGQLGADLGTSGFQGVTPQGLDMVKFAQAGIPAAQVATAAANAAKGMGWKDALTAAGVAAPVIGALISSGAIKSATGTQAQATQQAIGQLTGANQVAQGVQNNALQQGIDSLRGQFDRGVGVQNDYLGQTVSGLTGARDSANAELRPYADTGVQANTRLGDLLGISGNTGATGYGDLTKKFTLADFWDDPVTKASYQQGLDLGMKSINNSAARSGSLNSGATAKALARFGTDYVGNQAAGSQARFVGDQNNTYTRLKGVSDSGQAASGQIGANDITIGNLIGTARGRTADSIATAGNLLGTNEAQLRMGTATNQANQGIATGNNIASLISGQGNASAAGSIAQGNTFANAGNQVANWFNSQDTLDKILGARK